MLATHGIGINTILRLSFAFQDNLVLNDVAEGYADFKNGLGIVSGDDKGNFNPAQSATCGEAAKMIYGVLKAVLLRGK